MSTRHYKVEFDPTFFGGDYAGQGNQALIPEQLVEEVGMSAAFLKTTGHNPANIIHYAEDLRFNTDGTLCTDEPAIDTATDSTVELTTAGTVQIPTDEPVQLPGPTVIEIGDQPAQIETESRDVPRLSRRKQAA
jgi:hypothetical protein